MIAAAREQWLITRLLCVIPPYLQGKFQMLRRGELFPHTAHQQLQISAYTHPYISQQMFSYIRKIKYSCISVYRHARAYMNRDDTAAHRNEIVKTYTHFHAIQKGIHEFYTKIHIFHQHVHVRAYKYRSCVDRFICMRARAVRREGCWGGTCRIRSEHVVPHHHLVVGQRRCWNCNKASQPCMPATMASQPCMPATMASQPCMPATMASHSLSVCS
jgi:hypothetical protein